MFKPFPEEVIDATTPIRLILSRVATCTLPAGIQPDSTRLGRVDNPIRSRLKALPSQLFLENLASIAPPFVSQLWPRSLWSFANPPSSLYSSQRPSPRLPTPTSPGPVAHRPSVMFVVSFPSSAALRQLISVR
ncbi:hypothetical protein Ahy_A01g000607 isoform C [Arachis hypogaea]|uniref:Uncharacterized protein n=1 Tax=Arachis hypogaea TaxID=3818 RepID=A0A445EKN8_ARAHY|nr:hypothetical protein Ahy_A01g000607 isoform C [Arachis hypogaea]